MKNFRMLDWLVIAMLLAGIIHLIAPQQLPVTLYKLSLISIAAAVGYRIDRSMFPYMPVRTSLRSAGGICVCGSAVAPRHRCRRLHRRCGAGGVT